MQLFSITTLLVGIAVAAPSPRDVHSDTPVRIRIGVDRAASQAALTVFARDQDMIVGKSCSTSLNTGNFAQFPIISQLDDNGSGTGNITIGHNVYKIHSDTDASGGISCSRLFGEAILLTECDATIPATVQLSPVATEDLSICVTDHFFSAVLENDALQPALDPPTESSSIDFNSTDFNSTDLNSTDFDSTDLNSTDFDSTELDTELSKRQTPSPCTQWSPFTEKDGDGSPTQSMQFIQLSFSVAGALTGWASVGFAVEQSRSTGNTYTCTGQRNERVCKLEASIHPEIKALSDGKGRHRIGDVDRDSQALIFAETSAAELLVEEIEIDVRAVDFSNNELGGVCAGIVSRVGSVVAQLKEGDIVCGLAFPDHASTVVLTLAAYYLGEIE
ncbi:hypothetical protein THAR02_05074 [Trichoderma harzianum]|uniref:Cyanovirin-N domain-containing protein n=1 Tax=Trichoderma harzianum TaxID=5544 RepID=A0A0G0ACP0_TRIHA|nr:hypothetical protein THAR02_05074 [Trichoderma harzianum]